MTAITALLLFAAWTMVLMFVYVGYRTSRVAGGEPANSWTRGGDTPIPAFVRRAEHAHMNCVENLPVVAAVVLSAHVLGKVAVVDAWMEWVLFARLAQSAAHLAGTSPMLVQVRATFFTVQVLLLFYMIFKLV